MNKIIIFLVILAAVVGGYFYGISVPEKVGNVVPAGAYKYVYYSQATTTLAKVIKTSFGTLGSVVITGAGTGNLTLYDATTTIASQRGNIATTSLPILASIHTSAAAGNYVFDTSFRYGLMSVWSGNSATSTITYK